MMMNTNFSAFLLIVGVVLSCHGASVFDKILKINNEARSNNFEGDIVLPRSWEKAIRNGEMKRDTISAVHLWPKGDDGLVRVPYGFADGAQKLGKLAENRIAEVATALQAISCIRLVRKTDNDEKYIRFYKGNGCNSYVGMTFFGGSISLGSGCDTLSIIAHEVYHALGFHHEQSRPDRDSYVDVKLQNVKSGFEYAFDKSPNGNTFGYPYDRKSIMQYGKYSFSKNGRPTIVWKRNRLLKLGGDKLSKVDIGQLNTLYQCSNVYPRFSELRAFGDSTEETLADILEDILDEDVLPDVGTNITRLTLFQ